jgi:hypothetical protein
MRHRNPYDYMKNLKLSPINPYIGKHGPYVYGQVSSQSWSMQKEDGRTFAVSVPIYRSGISIQQPAKDIKRYHKQFDTCCSYFLLLK